MAKSGQARVLTAKQQQILFETIQAHRHPEKNTAIMQISFKLGLRAQEIALLEIKEVAKLNATGTDFKLLEVMALPAAYTKGANALSRSKSQYQRKTVSFDIDRFDQLVRQIEAMAKAGATIHPEDFYPPVKQHRGKSRDLPMVDPDLRDALNQYLLVRLSTSGKLMPTALLWSTQAGHFVKHNFQILSVFCRPMWCAVCVSCNNLHMPLRLPALILASGRYYL